MRANDDPKARGRLASGRALRLLLGPKPRTRAPEAARAAIRDDQRRSEVLVCLVQFAAIGFFGLFYALTPKAFPPDVMFEPVPFALGAYALFTGLRLWLALAGRLGPVFLGSSVVVDVAVLMLTIWSFHLQYEEPASIYLKAPTLLYVFILIALRTLRFEVRYVLLAGAAAVLGWSALVLYAVLTAGEMKITRSFSEYMTSHSILIGAEVDKLVSIAAVTAVLALAVVRARRLMERAALEAHAAAALSRFFAPDVAGEIAGADAALRPGEARRRELTVMMIDLRDFTGLSSRLPPEGIIALLAGFHAAVAPAVEAQGGSIDKYLGDGVLVTFGGVRRSETHAADALRAAEGVLAAFADWRAARIAAGEAPIGVGIGIASGPALVGVTGASSRLEFTVLGDVVNRAAKIEKHCKVVRRPLLAAVETLALAQAQGFDGVGFAALPDAAVEGIAAPLPLVVAGDARLASA